MDCVTLAAGGGRESGLLGWEDGMGHGLGTRRISLFGIAT